MWDKSAAKIGNSVAFLPVHYPSPGSTSETSGPQYDVASHGNQTSRPQAASMDVSTIGAFAYYVESLESLCRINIYFLQQKIEFSNRLEVSNWLTRFKELDLRLVQYVNSLYCTFGTNLMCPVGKCFYQRNGKTPMFRETLPLRPSTQT